MWRGVWYEGKHEPIFTADEWARLQRSFGTPATERRRKHAGLFADGPLILRCATIACGSKITYAPKFKPNGKTYHYYRCADGRRVHRGSGERQVNVAETDILNQLMSAADVIEITRAFADGVSRALNESHLAAMAAKRKSADVYRAELKELEQKENRLFDRYDSGEIDRAMFDQQVARVRAARSECFEKLREADTQEDEKYLDTAREVLELAKDAKSLIEKLTLPERRADLLALLVCNPRLEGRSVRFNLRKPFEVLAKMRAANDWRPQRDSNPR